MLKKMTENLGLKILALVFSIILWLVSININDPVSTSTYDTVVQLTNTETLTDEGKYLEVLGDTDDVRVTVRATRSVLSSLEDANIKAVADVSKITEDNLVPIELSVTRTNDKVEKLTPDHEYLELSVENIKRMQLPINVEVQNSPAEDYILGGTATSQNAVIISGPESVMEQLAYAAVDINVDGATSDVNISLPVKLYDADDHEIVSDKLTTSVKEVSTTATILYTKTVPVEYTYKGEPQEGYEVVGDMQSTISEVTISGKASVVKNVTKIEVTDAIDITDATRTMEDTVDIKKYFPSNVSLADSSDKTKAVVTVRIREQVEETEEED